MSFLVVCLWVSKTALKKINTKKSSPLCVTASLNLDRKYKALVVQYRKTELEFLVVLSDRNLQVQPISTGYDKDSIPASYCSDDFVRSVLQ